MGERIGFCLEKEVCQFCGKEFPYNAYQQDGRSRALKEKGRHESVCLVRFGIKKCPEEWVEKLNKGQKDIEKSQKIIDELTEGLNTGSIYPLLRGKAREIIEENKKDIRGIKRRLGEDPDTEEMIAILKEIEGKK